MIIKKKMKSKKLKGKQIKEEESNLMWFFHFKGEAK